MQEVTSQGDEEQAPSLEGLRGLCYTHDKRCERGSRECSHS
jgi:hypothetical protein